MTTPKATRTVAKQRELQREQDGKDKAQAKKGESEKSKKAVQAGPREHPEPPLPGQHLVKPGLEADMALKPQFHGAGLPGQRQARGHGRARSPAAIRASAARWRCCSRARAPTSPSSTSARTRTPRRRSAASRRRAGACLLIAGRREGLEVLRAGGRAGRVKEFGGLDILVNNAAFQVHADSHRGHHRRAPGGDVADQHLRLLLHGPRRDAAPEAGLLASSTPARSPACAAAATCSTTRRPRARSTPSPSRWPATWSTRASGSTRSRRARCGRRSTRPTSEPKKIAEFGKDTDMKRPAQPEEISPAYVFLASPVCSSYITGIVLPITGSVGS